MDNQETKAEAERFLGKKFCRDRRKMVKTLENLLTQMRGSVGEFKRIKKSLS